MFSGGGGACEGIRRAGGEVRLAVDFSPWAEKTHRQNFPDTRFIRRDVRELGLNEGHFCSTLEEVGLAVGSTDLMHMSPPCQPFSKMRHGIGDPARESFHSGVQQTFASTLSFDAAMLLHVAQPKCATFENVPGLAEQYPQVLARILDAFRFSNGERRYYCNWKVMDAQHFGVPQRRRRLMIALVRCDVADKIGFGSDEAILRLFPSATRSSVTIRAAFDRLVQRRDDEEVFFAATRRASYSGLLTQLPRCPEKRKRLKNVDVHYTLERCSWDHPAPTLTATGQKPNSLAGAIHPERDRKFTIPELKRLFGLPDEFQLMGTVQQAVDTICNMVPPPMEAALAGSIVKHRGACCL